MKVCSVYLLLLISCTVQAQRFNAYLSGGVCVSQVSGDALGGFDKAGLNFSAGVFTPVSRKADLGFEIGFMQKGSRKPSRLDQGDPYQYLLRLNYIEIPIYISFPLGRKLKAYAGPSTGVLIGSREENENGELSYSLPFNRIDVSVAGGISYLLNSHWHVNIRGIQSAVPVREFGGQTQPFFDGGQYNSVVALMLNYYFRRE